MTRSFSNQTFRFAPSSNGLLHLGHAYSAALNFDLAQSTGGRMLLRIENIDVERCRPEFEQAIYDDLRWLGLSWELPPRRQSEHFADYANALERLRALGVAYPCFCSRGEIMAAVACKPDWPRDPDGSPLYPGLCKHLSPSERARRLAGGRSAAMRIDMAAALAHVGFQLDWLERSPSGAGASRRPATPAIWGDAIIARRDIKTSYHIAVVTDDALQGVTDVVRGEDLYMATHLHRLLQTLLDLPAPTYRHHRLLRDASGQKLSKSLRAKSLRALRQEGLSPQAARESLKVEATAAS
ncbi:glutamyl-tRNA synthetase class Ic [Methylocella silvestris BL2]|uniref:Glutamyl-tRNA synthetase class Ic n=1 Tax=Methylocella silvestris (strain DSM 15510 / CIP 108128 / LMG 27833 / NCIMB 13906 / BL2) TaxID=395965 RepID=B8EQI0_METSB|nr:tRNA glutamyl-Q(34) synthetase GluQRS [Methylocella silvestris]ACK52193.1 glutamyl-tRNA synthetase class Ic [Methylocella silvestris BL2]